MGPINERSPHGIPSVRESHADDGIPSRLVGCAYQAQACLGGCSPAFPNVAPVAGADDVVPSGAAALGARYDMIQGELSRGESPATILTGVVIAGENAAAVEPDFLPGQLGEGQHPNDPGSDEVEADRADPIAVGSVELSFQRAKLGPIVEVVRNVTPVLDADDLRDGAAAAVPFEQEGERAANTDDA